MCQKTRRDKNQLVETEATRDHVWKSFLNVKSENKYSVKLTSSVIPTKVRSKQTNKQKTVTVHLFKGKQKNRQNYERSESHGPKREEYVLQKTTKSDTQIRKESRVQKNALYLIKRKHSEEKTIICESSSYTASLGNKS